MVSLTIVVPVLNESKGIERFLNRLLDASPDNAEIILVDGGSQDGTQALIRAKSQQHSRLVILESSPGRATQMNEGAKSATGDILLFLHADTSLPKNYASELEVFAASDLLWGRFNVVLNDGAFAFRMIAWFMNHRSRLTGIATGDQAIFVKKAAFSQLEGFPNQLLMEDVEFCKRAKVLSKPFCSRTCVETDARRWKKHGVIRTILLMWSFRLQYFLGESPENLHRKYYSK